MFIGNLSGSLSDFMAVRRHLWAAPETVHRSVSGGWRSLQDTIKVHLLSPHVLTLDQFLCVPSSSCFKTIIVESLYMMPLCDIIIKNKVCFHSYRWHTCACCSCKPHSYLSVSGWVVMKGTV